MPTMTVRIDDETSQRLDQLAKATERSKSWVLQKALSDYLTLNAWQVAEIKAGVQEADVGDFVEHDDLKRNWEDRLANTLDQNRNA